MMKLNSLKLATSVYESMEKDMDAFIEAGRNGEITFEKSQIIYGFSEGLSEMLFMLGCVLLISLILAFFYYIKERKKNDALMAFFISVAVKIISACFILVMESLGLYYEFLIYLIIIIIVDIIIEGKMYNKFLSGKKNGMTISIIYNILICIILVVFSKLYAIAIIMNSSL